MIRADLSLQILNAFNSRTGDEIIGKKNFEAHDHGGVRATHPCACDRGSRPCYYLQLAGEKRHQGFRCALDINEVDVEAVLLEKSHVFGHPKDGRRACIGGNVDKVKFLLSIELVPTAAQQKDD